MFLARSDPKASPGLSVFVPPGPEGLGNAASCLAGPAVLPRCRTVVAWPREADQDFDRILAEKWRLNPSNLRADAGKSTGQGSRYW